MGKRNPAGLSRGRLRRPGFVVIGFVWGASGASTCRESWRRTKRRGLAALALQTSLNRLPPFRKSNDPRVQSMVRGSRRGLLMASSSQRSQPSPLPAGDHPGLAVSRGFQPSSDGRPFSSYFLPQDQNSHNEYIKFIMYVELNRASSDRSFEDTNRQHTYVNTLWYPNITLDVSLAWARCLRSTPEASVCPPSVAPLPAYPPLLVSPGSVVLSPPG